MSTDPVVKENAGRTASSKRKRSSKEEEEIEIDVNLPEPPSKKAKRKEKKSASSKQKDKVGDTEDGNAVVAEPASKASSKAQRDSYKDHSDLLDEPAEDVKPAKEKHGEHGVWIGNLPFTATRDYVRTFLKDKGSIEPDDIVRLHLPGPTKQGGPKHKEQHNRGFAYIDFKDQQTTDRVIALSEKLLDGRPLLIKDSKNFEGRPKKLPENNDAKSNGEGEFAGNKQVSRRVFIGNLAFDVTKDEIYNLYAPAGDVEDVFLATFEDSGKCKGFGWVTFASTTASEAAVKGYLYRETVEDEISDDRDRSDEEIATEKNDKKSKPRRQKIWVNRINGRDVRCEFAEDPQTRYKKRFGKDKPRNDEGLRDTVTQREFVPQENGTDSMGRSLDKREVFRKVFDIQDDNTRKSKGRDRADTKSRQQQNIKPDKEERRAERRKKHDARTIAPGEALASTQRASGAIVAGSGKKVTFD